VLDAVLTDDPTGRVACEVLVTTGICIVAGEITTTTYVDVPRIARGTIEYVGYNDATYGFDSNTCGVHNLIQSQSPDIAMGVDTGGAGDQGLMFGYACDETPELMPLPIMMAHKLVRVFEARRAGRARLPAARRQEPGERGIRGRQAEAHRRGGGLHAAQRRRFHRELRREVKKHIIDPIVPSNMVDSQTKYHINPTGRFVSADRTAIPASPAARSSSIPTAAWAVTAAARSPARIRRRWTARPATWRATSPRTSWLGLATRCEVQLAYAIGVAEPVSVMVNTFGTGSDPDERFTELVRAKFPADAARHHRSPEAAPSDLPEDGGVRALRADRRHLLLGSDGQGGSDCCSSS
jgi:S-adenosylmethionine synthetase